MLARICAILLLWPGVAFAQAPLRALPSTLPSLPADELALYARTRALIAPGVPPAGLAASTRFLDERVSRHGTGHATCGTRILGEVRDRWNALSKPAQEAFSVLFQRPSMARSVVSEGGNFLIHYNTSGIDAPDLTDDDSNGVPDYVDTVAKTFEEVWELEVGTLGTSPPSDGNATFDVFIRNLSTQGAYGFTYPENFGDRTTYSYMEIDNNFTDNIYQTRGLDGVRVTAAHEFFHAIQFGYYAPFDAAWWQELTATWMEDVAYDDINDYYQYTRFFFEDTESSLSRFNFGDYRPFAASIFGHYLADVYGPESIRQTWETMRSKSPEDYALSHTDEGLVFGFAGVMPRFAIWNYLTGSRARTGYYEEAADYQELSPRVLSPVNNVAISASKNVDHLGATYFRIVTGGVSGGLRLTLTLETGATWDVAILLVSSSRVEVLYPQGTAIEIPNVGGFSDVVVIPLTVSMSGSNFSADLSVLLSSGVNGWSDLVGDFDRNGSVAFADFVTFANVFGTPASQHATEHDLNGDGSIDFGDFVIFARHFGDVE